MIWNRGVMVMVPVGLVGLAMSGAAGAIGAGSGGGADTGIRSTYEETEGSEITAVSAVRRGARVTLHGVVDRIRDEDEFVLRDDTGKIRVFMGWKNDMPVAEGETVTVEGRADDDAFPGMRPEIYAVMLTLANGDRVNFRTGEVEVKGDTIGPDL